jgi:hypothetical protein
VTPVRRCMHQAPSARPSIQAHVLPELQRLLGLAVAEASAFNARKDKL